MEQSTLITIAATLLLFAAITLAARTLLTAVLRLAPRDAAGRGLVAAWAASLGAWASRIDRFRGAFDRLQRDLGRAGRAGETPAGVLGTALLYAAGAGTAAAALTIVVARPASPAGLVLSSGFLGAATATGIFSMVLMNVRTAADRRVSRIVRQLPYSIDFLVLAIEAGASFDEGLTLLARDLPDEPLHEELAQVLRDQRLGQDRRQAFRNMATRLNADDVSTVVLALEIGAELGTPVAETLRRQSDDLRVARLLRADRLAREASAKMALPNTLIMAANVLLIVAPFLPKLLSGGLP